MTATQPATERAWNNADRVQLLGEIAGRLEGRIRSLDTTYGLVGASSHGRGVLSDSAAALENLCSYAPDELYRDRAKVSHLHRVLRELLENGHISEKEYWVIQ